MTSKTTESLRMPIAAAHGLLETAVRSGGRDVDVYTTTVRRLKIEVLNGVIEAVDELTETSTALRIIKDNRLGFTAVIGPVNESNIDALVRKAMDSLSAAAPDEFLAFPDTFANLKKVPDLQLADLSLGAIPLSQKIERAMAIEKAAYGVDPRVNRSNKVVYEESEYEVALINNRGFEGRYVGTSCSGYGDMIAREGDQSEDGFGMDAGIGWNDFDPVRAGREAGVNAVSMIGAKSLPSQKMDIVFEPMISTSFLSAIEHLFSGDAVLKGKSLLAGKLGQAIASPHLTILDSGNDVGRLGSSPFDAEGSPTQKTVLLKGGKLESYLYNMSTAKRAKAKTTGNASRPDIRVPPSVGTNNFYIEPGRESGDAIVARVVNGLFITRVMGMHTINPISGDFSIGAAGILIENGKKTRGVRGITIAGNLIDFMKHIEAVGSDQRFVGSTGAPTLLISGIQVAGSV